MKKRSEETTKRLRKTILKKLDYGLKVMTSDGHILRINEVFWMDTCKTLENYWPILYPCDLSLEITIGANTFIPLEKLNDYLPKYFVDIIDEGGDFDMKNINRDKIILIDDVTKYFDLLDSWMIDYEDLLQDSPKSAISVWDIDYNPYKE